MGYLFCGLNEGNGGGGGNMSSGAVINAEN